MKIDCETCTMKDLNFCEGHSCMYKEDKKYGKRAANYTPYLELSGRRR